MIEPNAFEGLDATAMYLVPCVIALLMSLSDLFGSYVFSLASNAFSPTLSTFM